MTPSSPPSDLIVDP
jgi:hypothetical protein